MVTGNKSEAPLLTIKRLTSWRGYAQQQRIYFYSRALRRAWTVEALPVLYR